jgi:hypothetical protein
LKRLISLVLATGAIAACGGHHNGLQRTQTHYFSFERPAAWKVQITRPAKPSHPGELIARSVGAPGTRGDRPLVAVDAMPEWTASLDGFADAIAFSDNASYVAYQQLGRTSPRVDGASGARLLKGQALGRGRTPVRVFDLLALSKGHVAAHMLVAVSQPDVKRVPVRQILDSLQLRR